MTRARARRRFPTAIESILVAVIVLLTAVVVVTIVPRIVGPNTSPIAGTLSVGGIVAYPPASFWALGTHAVKINDHNLSSVINETPVDMFRFGGGGDTTNVTTGVSYSDDGSASPPGLSADAAFTTFCHWRACHSIITVPGEIDDPGAAAVTVRFVEQTLGLRPDYWSIGNEPNTWVHYGIPWTSWKLSDASTPTPLEYAKTVQRDIAAMRSVDPNAQIIGIQSSVGGSYAASWITPLVQVNGPNLAAIAYHSYPANQVAEDGSLSGFLSNAFRFGFPHDYRQTQSEVRAACPSCSIPVFVDEFNGAGLGVDNVFDQSYADVPIVAAAVAGGLQLNATQFSFFDLQGLGSLSNFGLLGPDGSPRPSFVLYSTFFHNLSTATIENTSVVGGPGGVAAVVGTNATTTSLLVANTNGTVGLELTLNGTVFAEGGAATIYAWDPTELAPEVTTVPAGGLSTTWLVPPEGVLLIDLSS
ncbi:MAG: hypothetical protein L3K18_07605 [Thermoplasmata archaeon]|nr:hypothetical protein [Thermoplasmata archaeon]